MYPRKRTAFIQSLHKSSFTHRAFLYQGMLFLLPETHFAILAKRCQTTQLKQKRTTNIGNDYFNRVHLTLYSLNIHRKCSLLKNGQYNKTVLWVEGQTYFHILCQMKHFLSFLGQSFFHSSTRPFSEIWCPNLILPTSWPCLSRKPLLWS